MKVNLKSEKEIEIMREGGKILADIINKLKDVAQEGIKLKNLDILCRQLCREANVSPAFLNYHPYGAEKPYPASLCASVNEVIVHGIPNNYILKSGDILKIDMGIFHNGFYTDSALTIGIGKISSLAERLIIATKKSLSLAIAECYQGKKLGDIGFAINKYIKKQGFKVIKGLTGHGIGKNLHEDPIVHNDSKRGIGITLVSGMVLAIEPMVSAGSDQIIQLKDDSYATEDGSLSAHFEHTVAITDNDPIILTL